MRFGDELAALGRRLHMPYHERIGFLEELRGDLEAVFDRYVASGLGLEDARRRALAEIDLTAEDVEDLDEIHASTASRVISHLPKPIAFCHPHSPHRCKDEVRYNSAVELPPRRNGAVWHRRPESAMMPLSPGRRHRGVCRGQNQTSSGTP